MEIIIMFIVLLFIWNVIDGSPNTFNYCIMLELAVKVLQAALGPSGGLLRRPMPGPSRNTSGATPEQSNSKVKSFKTDN